MENVHLLHLIILILENVYNSQTVISLIKINKHAKVDLMLVFSMKLSLMELEQHLVNLILVPQNNKAHNILAVESVLIQNLCFIRNYLC